MNLVSKRHTTFSASPAKIQSLLLTFIFLCLAFIGVGYSITATYWLSPPRARFWTLTRGGVTHTVIYTCRVHTDLCRTGIYGSKTICKYLACLNYILITRYSGIHLAVIMDCDSALERHIDVVLSLNVNVKAYN